MCLSARKVPRKSTPCQHVVAEPSQGPFQIDARVGATLTLDEDARCKQGRSQIRFSNSCN